MKELSIEEKAKRYDNIIEETNRMHSENCEACQICIEELIPELTESEDERIRKDLIIYLRSILSNKKYGDKFIESWIDWLEKQGEHARFRRAIQVGDQVTKNEDGVLVNLSQLKRVAKPRQKPVDKVEPKFKEGDWVVCEAAPKFTAFKTGDVVQISNKETLKLFLMFEDCFRLWDISKDAKEGDVLSFDNEGSNYHSIGIFKRIASKNEPNGNTYRCYVRYGGFKKKLEIPINGDELHHCGTSAHPATKEQCDALMKAMADAGYTFDFDKKELKKIEQKSAWSEEDETALGDALWCCKQAASIAKNENDMGNVWYAETWLKSLRPQNTWKPSKRQKEALLWCVVHLGGADKQVLGELLEELNKL